MVKSAKSPNGKILILYDGAGTILCATDAVHPFDLEAVCGAPAWAPLNDHDAVICQAAILRCANTGIPQTFDVHAGALGLWRTTIYKCRSGKVHMIGVAREFPKKVLLLTDRQREICRLLGSGMTSLDISKKLDIARETVDNHRSGIAHRIGIKPASLMAWCGEHRQWF